MVNNHYRWDFIGLSTDEKPTPETSEKVVDGSTFYCSDTSTLYVFCKDNWYERKALGDGGGGSSVNVVQTTGTSTTDVMSQNAVTSMVFADPTTKRTIQVGTDSSAGTNGTAIGSSTYADTFGVSIGNESRGSLESVVIGKSALCLSRYGVAIGNGTNISSNAGRYSVALGWGARTSRKGEVNVGTGFNNYGFNDTKYRVIGGVHDGIDAHDATTVGQVNTRLGGLTLLPITQTDYDALTTKDPNTLYVITGA